MILPVIRELAEKYTVRELEAAALSFEEKRENTLNVRGKDEGEVLTNLLMAAVVRQKVEDGMPLIDAVREHTKMIQGIIAPKKI